MNAQQETTSTASKFSFFEYGDAVLRGLSQVVLQNNPLSGSIILLAIFVNSWVYGLACLVGSAVSTALAVTLEADRGQVKAGLFGFNGALVGIAVTAYTSNDYSQGDLPTWELWVLVVIGGAFSTIVAAAIMRIFATWGVPGLTMPFVLCGWLFVASVEHTMKLEKGTITTPAYQLIDPTVSSHLDEARHYTAETWYIGIGKGIAEIFLQDNTLTGYLILLGIAINTRLGALMALAGNIAAIFTAMFFGALEHNIQLGLYSYNSVLTALALGGLFVMLDTWGLLYAIFGAVVTVWVNWAASVVLVPHELPIYTAPFVITTWGMLLPLALFGRLTRIPPAEATTPEDHLKHFRGSSERERTETPDN